ncbi:MAG: CpaF family protein [Armatimonadetes bacterium]|jgi:pilus assembly protein CpaF|nr:CpaF family protein [Armatimonadota bacterium]MDI9582773.1 CpaF family protein [Acidobacteriota bacterium]
MVANPGSVWDSEYQTTSNRALAAQLLRLQTQVHERLLAETDLQDLQRMTREQLLERVGIITGEVARASRFTLTARMRQQVLSEVYNEVRGFGPIQALLDDDTITEVMVNGPRVIFVERKGKVEEVERQFVDDLHVMRILNKIIAPLGRRLDESMPMVDARLPDGSRVNAIIPPVSVTGPCVTIRKFSREPFSVDSLISFGTLTEPMREFLRACVEARLNILVSGGTGSGKTTTLNVLSSMIPAGERIVTIEDAAELRLQQRHVITLEARPPNLEGRGEITIRQLVKNALRMRPDRIVIGEVRGGEALDMLQAMNTGHDGSLSTCHANSPRDVLSRLETMTLMSGAELPSRAIREQIAAAIDLIVQQARLRDGSRRITHITEVQHMESDRIVTQDLYKFEQEGVDMAGRVVGKFMFTGLRPLFADKLTAQGVRLPTDLQQAWMGAGKACRQ